MPHTFKHIMITGGAGFVGSNLGIFLKRDLPEIRVSVLDNLRRKGSELNLPRLQKSNVGGGQKVDLSLLELTKLCHEASGHSLPIGSIPENRSGNIPLYISDCAKAQKRNGEEPKYSPETIIDEIVKWIRDHRESLRPIFN